MMLLVRELPSISKSTPTMPRRLTSLQVIAKQCHIQKDWVPPMCSACKVFGHFLAACSKSKKQVTPNPPEGGSKATSEGDWIKVQKKGKGKDVIDNRVSDLPLFSQEPSRVLNISVAVRRYIQGIALLRGFLILLVV